MIKHALFFLLCATAYGLKNGIGYLARKEILLLSQMEGEILTKDFETFTAAKVLVLSTSTIDRIEDDAFCGAPFAKIVLTNNSLPHLTRRMFSKCTDLRELKIAGNPGLTMDADIFHNLTRLEKLEIISQPIKTLTKEHLRGLPSLKTLVIGDSDLETIESGAFDQLHNLKELWLVHNKFRSLELRNLKHLKEVQVIDNSLEEFPLVEGLDNLRKFELSNNKIAKIEPSKVRNLPSSVVLDVRHNPISCESLKKLKEELNDEEYKIIVEKDDCKQE